MKPIIIITFLLLTITTVAQQQNTINVLMQEGASLFNNKLFNEALVKYKEIIKICQKNAEASYNAGLCSYNLGKFDYALTMFNAAIESDFKPNFCYFYISNIYKKKEQFEKSVQYIDIGISIYPNDVNLKQLFPQCHLNRGAEIYNSTVRAMQIASYANNSKFTDNLNKSLQHFLNAYKYSPTDIDIIESLIKVYDALGDDSNSQKYEREKKILSTKK